MGWFLYDKCLHHEAVKRLKKAQKEKAKEKQQWGRLQELTDNFAKAKEIYLFC